MQCPRCREDNPPQARFCMKCGAGLTVTCAKCSTELPTGAAFCFACGHPVAAGAGPARFASPGAYTPQHLAEKILTSKGALEGERKQVTVLFADLKGSLELLADRDPEDARRLLDPVLERMMEAVHHYEGTVNQVMGDGIMALFGAPLAHEDHAVRAGYAALRMLDAVRRHGEALRRTHGVVLQVRVGLNSGEVVVRAIESDLRMDYSAVGQTTHLAARMEQLATPGTILITAETARLVEGYLQVKALGPFAVKGLREPLDLFEVVGVGPARSRLQVAAARGFTRFVGRDTEMAQLRQALERAMRGHGQAVAVVGEPGVGKSRLFHEFKLTPAAGACLVLETVSASYGKAFAYVPLIELLRGYFQVEDRDDARRIREKVTGRILTLERSLEDAVPLVLALLAVDGPEPEASRLNPEVRRARTFEALKRLLIRESEVRPVVLVFEDLHWVDDETRAFLDVLLEGLPGARLLLLVNHRPELRQAWTPRSYSAQIWLEPLAPETAGDLLEALLGADPGLASLKQLLLARTGGNPLFLEEGVRSLVETGVLAGERGAYRTMRGVAAVQVPPTVQAIIAARIDRLAPAEKALLQLAAVIGEEIPLALLARVAEESEEALRPRLSRLQSAEFLYEARLFPEIAYTFRHGLTREVAYESLLGDRRRLIHGRIAAAIEALYPDRLAEHTEALALHYQRQEAWEKAFGYLVAAGDKASAAYANQAAIAFYTQALEAGERAALAGDARVAEVRLKRGAAFHAVANFGAAAEDYEHALAEARQAGDRTREGEILHRLAEVYSNRHDMARAVGYGEQALAIAQETGAPTVLAGSLVALGRLHMIRGALAEAEPLMLRAVREAQALGDPLAEARALGHLGGLYRHQGRSDEALVRSDRALMLARQAHDLRHEAMALYRIAQAHLDRGEYGRAMAAAEEWCRLGEARGERVWVPRCLNVLGGILGELGAHEPAIERNRTAAEMAQQLGEPMGEVSCNSFLDLAWHHLEQGDQTRGMEYLELVLRVVRDPASDSWMQWRYKNRLFYLAGTLWLARGDAGKAWEFARESLALAEETGAQKNVARSHLLWGELLLTEGRPAEAAAPLRLALEVAERTGQRPLVWQARAALGRLWEGQGKGEEAAREYRQAVAVIDAVAADVPPGELRQSFLGLPPVQAIRERLGALPRA